jgi:WD40 repeat protein
MRRLIRLLALFHVAALAIASAEPSRATEPEPLLSLETGGHMGVIRAVLFTPDGKQLISAGDDKVIRIWDLETGRTVRILRGEISQGAAGKIYALAISPDGRWLAVGGRTTEPRTGSHPIRIYDLATGEITALLRGHEGPVFSLSFSPDGRQMASAGADKKAILWDLASRSILQRFTGHTAEINRVVFTLDGERLVTASDDRRVFVWRLRDGLIATRSTPFRGQVMGLTVSPVTGNLAASTMEGEIAVLDHRTGRILQTMSSKGAEFRHLTFSADGRWLLTGTGAAPYHCVVFDVERGEPAFIYRGHRHSVLATAISPDGRLAATGGGRDNEIHVWELETGALVKNLQGSGASVRAVGFSRDGSEVAFGQTSVFRSVHDRGPLEVVLSLPYEKLRVGMPQRDIERARSFVRALPALDQFTLAHRVGGNFGYDADLDVHRAGRRIATIHRSEASGYVHNAYSFTPDGKTIIAGAGNGVLSAHALDGKSLTPEFTGHFGDVWAVAPSPDGRLLASGSDDQTMRLWNIVTRELIVSLFFAKDGDWVMWTPQGFYASSPGGDALVGWHVNRGPDKAADFVTARQLRQHFFRPDIVNDAIRRASAEQAIKSASVSGFRLSELNTRLPPEVALISPSSQSSQTLGRATVTIAVTEDLQDAVQGYTITVGDRHVPVTFREVDRAPPQQALGRAFSRSDRVAFEVPLAEGSNVIRISARNAVGESQPLELVLEQRGEGALDVRGTLYVLAVGVDKYAAGNDILPNLRFAGADAKSFESEVRRHFGPQHHKIVSRLLLSESTGDLEPSRNNIAQALSLLHEAGPNDTVVVFLAGHGDNEENEYVFFSSDSKLGDNAWVPDSVLSWTALLNALAQTSGRRFLFVDTCHSASAFNFRLMKDTADAEIIAYSATNREQGAQELEDLGHGVFTYALLEGLRGAADTNGDKVIRVFELGNYLAERVPELTKGEQTPDFYRRVGSANFVLVRL